MVDDLLPTLRQWSQAGRRIALATLVRVMGSSPRPLGSEMAIAEDGEVVGYVSGGCVEAAVRAEALACIQFQDVRLLDYGVGSPVMDLQLTCGGRIHILVRALRDAEAYVSHWARARERRESATAFTALGSGTTTWCDGAHASGSEDVFARVYRPRVRLVLVGSDPVALALIEFAARLGIEVRLVRPNGPTEAPRGLTADAYDARALPAALAAIRLDAFTAVYALSHEAAIDLAVLEWALRSPAFCVGALGSRNKIPARLATLRERGIDEAALERLHLPAGLAIGGGSAMEIALSIIAQVLAQRPAST